MATKNLVPRTAGEGKLGISTKKWEEINALTGNFTNISSSGDITASGNISSSGGIFYGNGSGLTGVTADWDGTHSGNGNITGVLTVQAISASGNISTSGDFYSPNFSTVGGNITASGNISSSGDFYSPNFSSTNGNITASGNISGSSTSTLTMGGATKLALTPQMTAGTGITSGTGTVIKHSVVTIGGIVYTNIYIDLRGLYSSDTDDIIGNDGQANCELGQITTAINGSVHYGKVTCFEAPTGGSPDIDLYYADNAGGAEDALATALTNPVRYVEKGNSWALTDTVATGSIPADKYLYLANGGAVDTDEYSAGKFLIELIGTI